MLHIRGTFKLIDNKKPHLILSCVKTKFVKYIRIIVIMQVNTASKSQFLNTLSIPKSRRKHAVTML